MSLSAMVLTALVYLSFQGSRKPAKPAKPAPKVGDTIPELRIGGQDGRFITLSSLKGKIVLVDFWASWCGPCRMENQNIVIVYNKYKDAKFKKGTGFEVYSISLDNQKEKWIDAIKKDNLHWPGHVSELMYWNDKTSKMLGVKTLPANFLIDGEGIILAKNITGFIPDNESTGFRTACVPGPCGWFRPAGRMAGGNPSVRGRAARPYTEGATRTFVRVLDTPSWLLAACTLTKEHPPPFQNWNLN